MDLAALLRGGRQVLMDNEVGVAVGGRDIGDVGMDDIDVAVVVDAVEVAVGMENVDVGVGLRGVNMPVSAMKAATDIFLMGDICSRCICCCSRLREMSFEGFACSAGGLCWSGCLLEFVSLASSNGS